MSRFEILFPIVMGIVLFILVGVTASSRSQPPVPRADLPAEVNLQPVPNVLGPSKGDCLEWEIRRTALNPDWPSSYRSFRGQEPFSVSWDPEAEALYLWTRICVERWR